MAGITLQSLTELIGTRLVWFNNNQPTLGDQEGEVHGPGAPGNLLPGGRPL